VKTVNSVHKMIKKWEGGEGFLPHISLRRQAPLKERINAILYRLQFQSERLKQTANRLQARDKELFDKCVAAYLSKDVDRASIYANECAEVRRMAKVLLRSQLALEQVVLRLQTVEDLGEAALQMALVARVVRDVKSSIAGVMPEVAFNLSQIDESLNSLMVETGEATGISVTSITPSEEAQKILSEASLLAEQQMKEKFPELPTVTPAGGMKVKGS